MIIDTTCGEVINTTVYIHDDTVELLSFDRETRTLHLSMRRFSKKGEKYSMDFLQVIGFEMSACDYWGSSECVLDFEYIPVNEQKLVLKLMERRNNEENCEFKIGTHKQEEYIETLMTFISGDELRVACEKIAFSEGFENL